MKLSIRLVIFFILGFYNVSFADIRLPAIIGDNMVLQGGIAVPVWGWAGAGKTVRVTFQGKTFTTRVGSDGSWSLKLGTYTAGGPYEMLVSGDGADIVLHNILVGEVWLASGQSNMEFGIQTDSRAAEAIAGATDTLIHFFCVPEAHALEQQKDIGILPEGSLNGHWEVCSPALLMAKNMAWHGPSAVGYYFARELRSSRGQPVGLIASYKGGTPAQAWTSLSGLERSPAFDKYVTRHESLVKGLDTAKRKDKDGGFNAPGNLYNAMIAPLIPYGIKGVIWYQGESNGDRIADACEYSTLFPRLITDWREKWGEGNFPFLFVLLANYRTPAVVPSEGVWPWVREAQLNTLSLPATGMAVITDVGSAVTIHPTDKYDVGVRLALAARHVAYHEKIVYTGPVYASMRVEGKAIRLHFSDVGGGLMAGAGAVAGAELKGFGIAGADRHFVWAKAVIAGDEVVVSAEGVAEPVAVRYNWADNPPGNLYNKEGLPASPFRTDHWDCVVDQPTTAAAGTGGRTGGVGGRTVYNGVFAPTEDWVKPAERPFRQDLCLDGLWDFAPLSLPAGFREGVDVAPALSSVKDVSWAGVAVRVPSPWNVNSFADQHGQGGDFRAYPSYPKEWENIKMGWLRKRFTVPADWKGQRMVLHFQAVAGDAVILVNGKTVGKHFGIFLPFEVDVTDAIMSGRENEICIGIRKASLFDKRGEYGRRTYQAGSFWGQHIAGIWQDVWLVALPEVHIADVYIRPLVDSGKLVAEVLLANDGKKAQTVTVDAAAFPWIRERRRILPRRVSGELWVRKRY